MTLLVLAGFSAATYLVLCWLSRRFADGAEPVHRPILAMLAGFGIAFAIYLGAQFVALKCPSHRSTLAIIFGAAFVFRLTLFFSHPILERDYYRYLWDGAVAAEGISPYRFSPLEVLDAPRTNQDPALAKLSQMLAVSPSLREILERVHYAELRTIYPPVSQAVFAAANAVTPTSAGLTDRVRILKVALLLFDVGTIVVLLRILRLAGRHPGWLISYAWCPLVLKEIANTAHLDAIAVFLVVTAVWLLVATIIRRQDGSSDASLWLLSGILLGLAVGAKLYPVAIVPVCAAAIWRSLGKRHALGWLIISAIAAGLSLLPMYESVHAGAASSHDAQHVVGNDTTAPDVAPSQDGLTAFLGRWEMNDFLFLLVVENLRTPSQDDRQSAWFAFVPESCRVAMTARVAEFLSISDAQSAFLLARALTGAVYLLILGFVCYRVVHVSDASCSFLEAIFLALAWLWLLAPTQNPWYWVWAVPFLPFARSRAWFLVSGLAFIYYARFWFQQTFGTSPTLGTPYSGAEFFDFVVTWLEFAPWLLVLFTTWALCRWTSPTENRAAASMC